MTPREQLADALVDGHPEVARAVAAAERALAAWSALPRSTRLAFPREARRMALRAASAVLAITTTLQERPHAPR
jgi:acyl-CoA reductase-like NAD-dependent aldehyde dehydrogenase